MGNALNYWLNSNINDNKILPRLDDCFTSTTFYNYDFGIGVEDRIDKANLNKNEGKNE